MRNADAATARQNLERLRTLDSFRHQSRAPDEAPTLPRFLLLLSCVLLFLGGCASVPPQSAELSHSIGIAVAENHRAYTTLLNHYFDQKREAIDQWIEETYTPAFFSNVRAELAAAGQDPRSFGDDLNVKLLRRIVKRRNEMQADLEQTRRAILDQVRADHAILTRANSELTALLQSAATVQETSAALAAVLNDASGGKIDFESLDRKFNEHLDVAADPPPPLP